MLKLVGLGISLVCELFNFSCNSESDTSLGEFILNAEEGLR